MAQHDRSDLWAEALLEAMSESVYVVDRDRTITYWNAAAEALTGFAAADVVGCRCRDNILNHVDEHGVSLCSTRCPLTATMRDGQARETMAYLHHHDGHRVPVNLRAAPLRDRHGKIVGAVEVFHDNTSYRLLEDHLSDAERQALTDPLTGLANRRMLDDALRLRRDEQQRYGRDYALLFADVDHFKAVNDQHGHEAGDSVLQLVAATMSDCMRASDTAGRWGGEEFLLVATGVDAAGAVALADRVRNLVASSWLDVDQQRIAVTLSIGVAMAAAGESTSQLVARADEAMLTAKNDGRNRTVLADDPQPGG